MSATATPVRSRGRMDLDMWVRRGCALIVAAVAAYASYEHQRVFALRAVPTRPARPSGRCPWMGCWCWPRSGCSSPATRLAARVRVAVWSSFLLGIAVSLAANIAAATTLAWQPVLVAGWPPVALLLAVELLAHRPRVREHNETEPAAPGADRDNGDTETDSQSAAVITLAEV
jgi:hypothetical protein